MIFFSHVGCVFNFSEVRKTRQEGKTSSLDTGESILLVINIIISLDL